MENRPQENQGESSDSIDDNLDEELTECEDSSITPLERKLERRVVAVVETRLQQQLFFQGPLPPPEMLKAYESIQPGLVSTLVGRAEKQAEHRMALEKKVIFGDQNKSWVGLFMGFFLACGVTYGGFVMIMNGHDIAGSIIDVAGMTSLIGIFVYGTNQRKDERIQKAKLLNDSEPEDDKE